MSLSIPASVFRPTTEMVSFRFNPNDVGLMFAWRSKDVDHGTEQLFRDAILPVWFTRHDFARSGADASSRDIPFATAVSGEESGSKMNGRSFLKPSPFTSPPTIGVKNPPDVSLLIAVSSKYGLIGHVTVPINE